MGASGDMSPTFVGCGDGFRSGGSFNTCVHVGTPETRFLIDCAASASLNEDMLCRLDGLDDETAKDGLSLRI